MMLHPPSLFADQHYSYRGNLSVQAQRFTSNDVQMLTAEDSQSAALSIELTKNINDTSRLVFEPFFRVDSLDNNRSHWDFRELKYNTWGDDWDFEIGIGKVFWGVAETRNVVNIINQLDSLEGPTTNETLGQPMAHYTRIGDWGNLEFFLLPHFRERSFAGPEGRPRAPFTIDTDAASYESSAGDKHIDLAVRYSHSVSYWDIGINAFNGTARQPLIALPSNSNNETNTASPFYYQIQHISTDLQATLESWLLKGEFAYETSDFVKSHFKTVSGFEYTFFDIKESGVDLGIVSEYLYDGSGANDFNIFQNDILIGMRLSLNDTQSTDAIIAYSYDIDDASEFLTLEFSRRIASSFKLNLEATTLKDENYLAATFGWYF